MLDGMLRRGNEWLEKHRMKSSHNKKGVIDEKAGVDIFISQSEGKRENP
jgi:hypothetical protein